MNNQPDYRELFLKAETSTGITKENFCKKFLYSSTESLDNYLLDRNTPSPSQFQGFSLQHEKNISYLMSELIFRAAQSLKLPVSTAIVAASVSHYFYSRVGLLDYDFRDVAMGAMFLACKSEETLRKSYEISSVFDQVFKIFEGHKMPIKILVLNSQEYEYMRKKVLDLQNHILFELGFEIYRLFDIPHRYIGGLFKSFERHPQSKKICQNAWTFLNDFYRTSCCLYYPGQIIAAASIYLSLLKLKIKMPAVAWWILMQANIESIEELIVQLESFYQNSRSFKYSLELVGGYINEVGQKRGLTNVFPVNYYRKIMLDVNGQLRIKKIQVEVQLKADQIVKSQNEVQNQPIRDQYQKYSRQSSHKKRRKDKKKDKKDKKKKDKKYKSKKRGEYSSNSRHSRSKSKSRDRKQQSSENKSIKMKKLAQSHQSPNLPKAQSELKSQMKQIAEKNEKIHAAFKFQQAEKPQKKEVVKQMQLESAKGLLSKISNQLNQRKKNQPKKPEPEPEPEPKKKEQSEDEDQQMLAALIQIKKNNAEKKGAS